MSNPTLKENILNNGWNDSLSVDGQMTINGMIAKTLFLGVLAAVTFCYNWSLLIAGLTDKANLLSFVGIGGALILSLFICSAPKNKFIVITTSLYAMCEGLVLGYISAIANQYVHGIASQAALGTIITLFGMFFLYKTNIVKCTDKFRMVLFNSTLTIMLIYLLQLVLGFFHIQIPGLFSNSLVGIGFSLLVVAIASFNLIVDFDNIEKFAGRANKNYEWYFGFSLLVTIVWLYIEILNLLMKLQSRNN
jgi:uncharacterized YccA/Bax inhibitor family protein